MRAKVTNIGIERFATSDGQENRAEHDETARPVVHEKFETMPRIDRGKHFRARERFGEFRER